MSDDHFNNQENSTRVVVRGSGDIGSAVAHALFLAGFAVVIHDQALPTVTRRKMAFTNAIYYGQVSLQGVTGRQINDINLLPAALSDHSVIPLTVLNLSEFLAKLKPEVLVDARMRKHQSPETQLGLARLTIGLGPNFFAGKTTDLAVETGWGDMLGQVISRGATKPLKGEPKPLAGHARDRYVYAATSGTFYTHFRPGDFVEQGQEIAFIDDDKIQAPLSGVLRGITHDEVPVLTNTKIIEVDPRGKNAQITGIAERPARIAQGVLQAVISWEGGLNAS